MADGAGRPRCLDAHLIADKPLFDLVPREEKAEGSHLDFGGRNGKCKGHLLCKIHFFMSFLHQHVSPLWKEILKVSGKKILSLFVLIHLYKNLSENELIRF